MCVHQGGPYLRRCGVHGLSAVALELHDVHLQLIVEHQTLLGAILGAEDDWLTVLEVDHCIAAQLAIRELLKRTIVDS